MAGFLHLVRIPAGFAGRVINIHPSLLPAFGGKGFHGMHVHRAVIDRGCTIPDGLVIGEDPALDGARFHRSPNGICLVTADMLAKIQA